MSTAALQNMENVAWLSRLRFGADTAQPPRVYSNVRLPLFHRSCLLAARIVPLSMKAHTREDISGTAVSEVDAYSPRNAD